MKLSIEIRNFKSEIRNYKSAKRQLKSSRRESSICKQIIKFIKNN